MHCLNYAEFEVKFLIIIIYPNVVKIANIYLGICRFYMAGKLLYLQSKITENYERALK